MLAAILNSELRLVNSLLHNDSLIAAKLVLMQKHGTLANRIAEAIDGDSGGKVARKLTLAGFPVTYQAVHKWLNGGNVTDENLEALAQSYRVNVAWLKYGQGEKRNPLIEVIDALPDDEQQQVLDFIEYRFSRPGIVATPRSMARYMGMIAKIREDMQRKKEPPKA